MTLKKRLALAFAAGAMVSTPIMAHASAGMDGARALTSVDGANELEGNGGWIIGLIGLLAGVTAMIIVASDDDDAPVSP